MLHKRGPTFKSITMGAKSFHPISKIHSDVQFIFFSTYLVKKSGTVQQILVMTVLLFIHFLTSFLSVNLRLKKSLESVLKTR